MKRPGALRPFVWPLLLAAFVTAATGLLAIAGVRAPVALAQLSGPRPWVESALGDLGRGRLELAIGKLRLAHRLAPDDLEAGVLLALALEARGEHGQALEVLQALPADGQGSAGAVTAMLTAWAYRGLGLADQAASAYMRALELDPRAALAHAGLGELAASAARLPDAAPGRLPSWPGGIPPASPGKWLALAEDHLRRAVELAPERVETYIALAAVLVEQKRLDAAREVLQKANRLDHRRAEVHFLLGLIYEREGRTREAASQYSRALELDPAHLEARQRLEQLGLPSPAR